MNATRAARWLALSVLLSAGLILRLEAQLRTDTHPASPEDTVTLFVDNALHAIPPYEEDGLAARTAVLEAAPASPGLALGDFIAVSDLPDAGCRLGEVVVTGDTATVSVGFDYYDRSFDRRFELVRDDADSPWLITDAGEAD